MTDDADTGTGADTHGGAEEVVADWSELLPKRAYVLRSPAGRDLLSTYSGPGEEVGSAVFFAHSPQRDGEFSILPGDGWTVLRSVQENA